MPTALPGPSAPSLPGDTDARSGGRYRPVQPGTGIVAMYDRLSRFVGSSHVATRLRR
jgi:hypothetical protein